ncbi:MAG: Na+/H+ antiporter NhaA [Romboutsia sp.]|uniref:Na+/H+ antiporter NhaA n=1 Tax=Romboutsia sp. TaxID=1965302 RepID=UPI003F2AB4F6
MRFLRTYRKSIKLEVLTSVFLILATVAALFMYNTPFRNIYKYIFEEIYIINDFSLHMFINDFLMAIFFLVAGLEIKHEILHGNLSSLKKASFPVIASLGGVIVPAIIFILLNKDTPFLSGFCIPISTDIAFAVGVFLIFSKKLNPSLKIFLLSLAVVDDLMSILAIGVVYSIDVNLLYLSIALIIVLILTISNRVFKVTSVYYYLIVGLCLWYFIYLSGVHSTISGVLLALTIPAKHSKGANTLEKLQKLLVPFNSLVIIPLFAFANTGISLTYNIDISNVNSLVYGIVLGLCIGKPLGIMLFSYIGCCLKITEKPSNISWTAVFLVSLIAGIGFTMSIFVSEIAFIHNMTLVNIAKMSILISACISVLSSILAIIFIDIKLKLKMKNHSSIVNKYYIS